MLAEIRDFLKTKIEADHYSIGKIDGTKDKSIGVYGDSSYMARVEAIGKAKTYDPAGIRILIHWNKNMRETETVARDLYEKLRYITDTDINGIHVYYLDLLYGEPVFVGTDDEGVYEYVIACVVYYER
jgi:hypothetical protein